MGLEKVCMKAHKNVAAYKIYVYDLTKTLMGLQWLCL